MTKLRPANEDELVELVRSIDVEAPATLRAGVERMIADARARGGLRRRTLTGAAAGAALAGGVAAVLIVSGGSTHAGLNLRAAAAPTLLAATSPAPRESDHSHVLAAAVDGVHFPYWEESFGLRSSGTRHDTLGGRTVTTVFYSHGDSRIGYAIYGGVPSPRPRGGSVQLQGGTAYRVLRSDGTSIISWMRGGHLCVMSSRRASPAELMRLAAWDDGA